MELVQFDYAHNSMISSATGFALCKVSIGYQPPLFQSQGEEAVSIFIIAGNPLAQLYYNPQTLYTCSKLQTRSESVVIF